MAKQLSITVRAVDQASGVLRKVAADTFRVGDVAVRTTRMIAAPVRALIGSLTSVRTLIAGTLGVLAVRRLAGSFNAATRELDEMAKASQRLGIGIETFSSLKFTADLANVSFEQLQTGIETAQRNLGQFVATGGGRAADAIRLLGVRVRDVNGGVRDMADLIPEIADAVNAVPDAGRRGFLVQRIFGESGSDFLNLLAEGGDRLRQLNAQARALGAIISPEQAAVAEAYRDAISRVQAAWLGLRARLLEQVGPTLTELTNKLASFIAAVPEMVGNLMTSVRTALAGGPDGEGARQLLGAMVASWGSVLLASIKGLGRIAVAGVMSVLDIVLGQTDGRLDMWFESKARELPHQAAILINSVLKELSLFDRDLRIYQGRIDASRTEIELIRADSVRMLAALRSQGVFGISFDTDFPRLAEATRLARDEMAAAGQAAFTATDQVLGFVEALSRAAIPELISRPTGGKNITNFDYWQDVVDGWEEGWESWLRGARDGLTHGLQLANGVANALSSGLSTAINGVIQGTKNLGAAFREFASSTLKRISELIVQMLVFRGLASAIGFFAPAGGGGDALLTLPGTAFARLGKVFQGGRVTALAAGGILAGGAVVDRPTVFPMARGVGLMGEAGPEAVLPLRRAADGRLGVEASAGGALSVTINVTVRGGGDPRGTGQAVGREAAEVFLSALERNPTLRERTRRALA